MNATADWQEVKSESQLSLKIPYSVCVGARECHNETGNHSVLYSRWGSLLLFDFFFNHIN